MSDFYTTQQSNKASPAKSDSSLSSSTSCSSLSSASSSNSRISMQPMVTSGGRSRLYKYTPTNATNDVRSQRMMENSMINYTLMPSTKKSTTSSSTTSSPTTSLSSASSSNSRISIKPMVLSPERAPQYIPNSSYTTSSQNLRMLWPLNVCTAIPIDSPCHRAPPENVSTKTSADKSINPAMLLSRCTQTPTRTMPDRSAKKH